MNRVEEISRDLLPAPTREIKSPFGKLFLTVVSPNFVALSSDCFTWYCCPVGFSDNEIIRVHRESNFATYNGNVNFRVDLHMVRNQKEFLFIPSNNEITPIKSKFKSNNLDENINAVDSLLEIRTAEGLTKIVEFASKTLTEAFSPPITPEKFDATRIGFLNGVRYQCHLIKDIATKMKYLFPYLTYNPHSGGYAEAYDLQILTAMVRYKENIEEANIILDALYNDIKRFANKTPLHE